MDEEYENNSSRSKKKVKKPLIPSLGVRPSEPDDSFSSAVYGTEPVPLVSGEEPGTFKVDPPLPVASRGHSSSPIASTPPPVADLITSVPPKPPSSANPISPKPPVHNVLEPGQFVISNATFKEIFRMFGKQK